jgi:chorismate synthase
MVMAPDGQSVNFLSNQAGGVLGGISTGKMWWCALRLSRPALSNKAAKALIRRAKMLR